MMVFRITTEEWCTSLQASGNAARWNARGRFVIYAAGSRSLACLENLVHRSGVWQGKTYKVMVIEFSDNIKIETIEIEDLKKNWERIDNFSYCRTQAGKWLNSGIAAILKVPSVIIKKEFNYLINPQHPDFKFIKLKGVEDFDFDQRF